MEVPNKVLDEEFEQNIGTASKEHKPNFGPIDHVKQNIKLSSKINKIRDVQNLYRNFVREKNQMNMKQYRDEVDIIQRELVI